MDQRPLSLIARDMMDGLSGLVRGEVQLAKAELTEGAKDATFQMAKVAIAGVIALLGALSLLAFAVIGLGELLGDNFWLSALIVGLVFLIPGAILAAYAARNIRVDMSFRETRNSLREDARMMNDQIRDLKRTQREEMERIPMIHRERAGSKESRVTRIRA